MFTNNIIENAKKLHLIQQPNHVFKENFIYNLVHLLSSVKFSISLVFRLVISKNNEYFISYGSLIAHIEQSLHIYNIWICFVQTYKTQS